MDQPLVSICIPVYNGAEFLKSALDSVLQQTYSNVEVIISDDASKDNSLEIVKSYARDNWQVFEHETLGLVGNWNFCIQQSQGKYIKFLFQDDLLDPTCIEKMVAAAEQDQEIGLVFSARRIISELDLDPKHFREDLHNTWSLLKPFQQGMDLLIDDRFTFQPHNKIGEPTNVLMPVRVFQKVGFFDKDFKQLPDLEMWCRILSKYKVAFIDEQVSSFRIHAGQTTNVNRKDEITHLEIFKLWQKMTKDVVFSDIPEPTKVYIRNKSLRRLLKLLIKNFFKGKWFLCEEIIALLKYKPNLEG